MKVTLVGIYERGILNNERVHFRASVDLDLNYYAVFDTQHLDANRIFLDHKSCYWFSAKQIKTGDNIVLYTRAGVPNVETRNDGTIYHFFFRGLNNPLYPNPKNCAVILEINSWISSA
jgi:hypothetical protein